MREGVAFPCAGTSRATCCTFDFVGKLLAVGNVLGRTVGGDQGVHTPVLEHRAGATGPGWQGRRFTEG